MKSASADTAASLRDWVTAAFQTMNEVNNTFLWGFNVIMFILPSADRPKCHRRLFRQAGGRAKGQLNGEQKQCISNTDLILFLPSELLLVVLLIPEAYLENLLNNHHRGVRAGHW